jgi:hypothetical protein
MSKTDVAMNSSCLSSSRLPLLFSLGCSLSLALDASILQMTSQTRMVMAAGNATDGDGIGFPTQDSDTFDAMDDGVFIESAIVSVVSGAARGTATATMDSGAIDGVSQLSVTASTTARGRGSVDGDDADGNATSLFELLFQVSAPVNYSLTGSLSQQTLGGAPTVENSIRLGLSGGADIHAMANQNSSFAWSGVLQPGTTYRIEAMAHALSFYGDNASAGFNLSFGFTPVPEPELFAAAGAVGLLGWAVLKRRRLS